MIDAILAKVFGTKHEREIKTMRPIIAAINELEPESSSFPTQNWPPRPLNSNSVWRRAPRSTTC